MFEVRLLESCSILLINIIPILETRGMGGKVTVCYGNRGNYQYSHIEGGHISSKYR